MNRQGRFALIATLGLLFADCRQAGESSLIVTSGHVEATDVRVSTKVSGYLESFPLKEGSRVGSGEELARIDAVDTRLALEATRAQRDQADAELRLRLAGSRPEEIAEAEAHVTQAEAELGGAQQDLDRMQGLLEEGSGTAKARDDARTRRDVAQSAVQAARERLRRLLAGSRREEIDVARARLAAANASIAQLEQQMKDAGITSPISGVITEKLVEQGELLAAGATLAVVTDLNDAWLTIYVAEPDLARIRIGQEAEVGTDDGQKRKGTVSFIASEAEFTPRNVQTRDERVKLVFKVKIHLDNRDGLFKPGMPAEARLKAADPEARNAMTGESGMVRLEEATHRYGAVTAVDSLSFRVERGETFGLIGPDGAGKTTTLRMILGILAAHHGRVVTCGLDPFRKRRALSERIGYLSQRFSLYGDLTIDENIAFFAEVHGVRRWKPRRDELLEMLRLAPFRTRLAERLSGGMKQKLALACTLIHTPDLLVLDEPTTGVDPVSRRDFWKILVRLQRGGLTILLTTPYLDEAERCQRVALLDHGRLLALDTPDALRGLSPGTILEVLATPRRRAAEILAARSEVTDVETFGERLHVTLAAVPPAAAADAATRIASFLREAGIQVEASRPTLPSLEDIFIARIRDAASAGSSPSGAAP